MAALNNKLTNIYSNQTFAASVQGSNTMANNIPNMSLQGRLAGGQAVPTRVHHGQNKSQNVLPSADDH
jgi:hypothetical protein